MAYINFQNCSKQQYEEIIYSGDAKNKLKILFNGVELENADNYCESIKRKARILSNDGNKRFSLDNFVATELEVVFHNIEASTIQDQVEISIGTKVGTTSLGDTYEYVPLGIFNIQDTPTTDKDKVTIKLRDNASLFDFKYNAEPLIEQFGTASKIEILRDICTQANVTCNVFEFNGMNDELAIYDNSISGRVYVSYIAEQAGKIATIDRDGSLIFVDLTQLTTQRIPLSIVEKYTKGDTYKLSRVVYEDGIRKFENPTEEESDYDNLYINTSNPYISNQEQIDYIYNLLNGFEIDSLTTGKILGNPSIDSYDIIEIYDDYSQDETVIARTLANHTLTYRGVMTSEFDTQIAIDAKQENVTLTGEATFQKYAKTNIDNLNNNVTIIVGQQNEQQEQINQTIYDLQSIQNLFQITGGTNLIKNSQFLLTDEVWDIDDQSTYVTPLGQGYNASLIGRTTSLGNIVMKNATINTKSGNIANLKTNQQYTLGYYYTLEANTTARVTLTGANNGIVVFDKEYTESTNYLTREVFQFVAYDTDYILNITTSTTLDGSFTIYDLMLNSGDEKPWEPAISEVYSTVLKMSQLGLQVYASGSGTITLLTSQGFTIYTSNNGEIGQVVTDFTDTGIDTIDIYASGRIKNGTWVDKDLTINSYNHHIEYMEVD